MAHKVNPRVISRFRGTLGRQQLAKALLDQSLLSANSTAAKALAKQAKLLDCPINHQIMTQGGQDNDLYFILSGSVRILVNGREVAIRRAREHVGEMALIDITAIRSATVITAEPSIIARVSEPDFTRIVDSHPVIWRKLAGIVAQRLRERNRFLRTPHSIPSVFIGSSSEALPVATAIFNALKRRRVEARVWSEGVFQCSRATIEDLMAATDQSDFAILILAPDDVTISRSGKKPSPRDNTIFELGLFMGALSRERAFIIAPKPLNIKIPTDLLGVTLLTYQKKRGQSTSSALRPVTRALIDLISRYGPK